MANAEYTNFYEHFYNSFLTSANGLPINSMWIVSIDKIPSVGNTIENYENWNNFKNSHNIAKTNIMETVNQNKGLIIAQGVKIVGEGMETSREGYKNTGFIQGLIGSGRTSFPIFNVSFVENNLSFTDYVLRPWLIAVTHKSLKDQSLRANISVTMLTRMGPNKGLAQRKVVKYHDCCPVLIDEMEHNYSGSDMVKLRNIQFVYSHYEIIDADKMLFDMLGVQKLTNKELEQLQLSRENEFDNTSKNNIQWKKDATSSASDIAKWLRTKNPFDPNATTSPDVYKDGTPKGEANKSTARLELIDKDVTNHKALAGYDAKQETSSGDKTTPDIPYVSPHKVKGDSFLATYINHLTDSAKAFGTDLVKGTLKNVFTNTVGALEDTVVNEVNKLKADTHQIVNNATDAISDAVSVALGHARPMKASGPVNTNMTVGQNDTPMHTVPRIDDIPNNPTVVDVKKITNQNDNVTAFTPISFIIRKPNTNDYITGLQPMQDDKKPNQNDYITGIQTAQNGVTTNQNDHITGKQVNSNIIPTNQNDVVNKNNIQFTIKNVNQNDALRIK